MPGTFADCPFCKAKIQLPPLAPGVTVTCPHCQRKFGVTAESPPAASPPAPQGPEDPKPAAAPKPKREDLIPVVCFRCGTRTYAHKEQLGTSVKCPDCHSMNEVRLIPGVGQSEESQTNQPNGPRELEFQAVDHFDSAANRSQKKLPAAEIDEDDDAELVLREPEAITHAPVKMPTLEEIIREKRFEEDWREETLDQEVMPFVSGVVSFLFHPEALQRWIILGLGAAFVSFVGHRVLIDMEAGGIYLFFALAELVAAILFGTLVAIPTAVNCLHVITNTANGHDRIENWPGFDFMSWGSEALVMFAAIFLSAVPGLIVGWAFNYEKSAWVFWVGPTAASIWILLPIVLLSMLDQNSIIAVYSAEIIETWKKAPDGVMLFYVQTCLVMIGVFLATWVQASSESLMNAASAFVIVMLGFVYARLLGRLMIVCQRKAAEAEAKQRRGAAGPATKSPPEPAPKA